LRPVTRALFVFLFSSLFVIATLVPAGFGDPLAAASTSWVEWAKIGWSYFQVCWNSATGLSFDACGWHHFTDWGIASYILAIVSAHELGLLTDTETYSFEYRVDKVLTFLNSRELTGSPGQQVPYGVYDSDTGLPMQGGWGTNTADYGRLLVALYVLKAHLNGLGGEQNLQRTGLVDSAVGRVDHSYYGFGTDLLYAYYASLGFSVWAFDPSKTSVVQNGFQELIQNGPFVSPSSMYGVKAIPDDTRIDGEPFIDAILELGDVPEVNGLASWSDFVGLARLVYDAQEKRSEVTGKPEFWTGGGLDFDPGFVSEWIVWDTGATWVALDNNGNPTTDPRLPVAYAKLMFAYNALYGTAYTENMLNTYASRLQTTNGFEEGIYANGATNTNVHAQTNQIILTAARYVIQPVSETPGPGGVAITSMLLLTAVLLVTRGTRRKKSN
jgi:hypothetical protein